MVTARARRTNSNADHWHCTATYFNGLRHWHFKFKLNLLLCHGACVVLVVCLFVLLLLLVAVQVR